MEIIINVNNLYTKVKLFEAMAGSPGYGRATVSCKRHRLLVRFPLKEIKYYLIFTFLHCGDEANKGGEVLPLNT